ncbi:MAG TPA: hypothetical protein VFI42_14715 [Thermomicrobiaceae bacterium]|nr:hypothetical protein [Thermomicrobiaceae bacterium]
MAGRVDIGRRFIREQSTATVAEYRRRVYRLAAIYLGLLVVTITTIAIIVVNSHFFVLLAQRSNVETAVLLFIIVLFAYLGAISAPGVWGALRIVYYDAPTWLGRDALAAERRKQQALRQTSGTSDSVYLNQAIALRGQPDAPLVIPIADAAGSLGEVHIDGARMVHHTHVKVGSNSMFAFFSQRIEALVTSHPWDVPVEIVQWTTIDDEQALEYGSLVSFARNLQRQLQGGPLWPTVELSQDDLDCLIEEASALCPALRNEGYLPDVEYRAEHKLPIIPEPLAFISLSRSEQRADPAASMGCALLMAFIILAVFAFLVLVPPWVPPR